MRANRSKTTNLRLWGTSAQRIAQICKVHISTARRWKRCENEAPESAIRLIEIFENRALEVFDPAWSGWRIVNGKLVSPEGLEFTAGDVLATIFLQQLIADYKTEQRWPRQADWVDERWTPAQEIAVNE